MNGYLFQILLLLSNALCGVAWWALRQEIRFVREILTVKQQALEDRVAAVESKCADCPTSR